jgi:hypothetical protein
MTNNKQQTAVEWFWNQLPEILPFTVDTETAVKLQKAYQQSKEMEKEQHLETHQEGMKYVQYIRDITNGKSEYWKKEVLNFTNYYEQTYGGGEQ